jgi:hypothetical protein
MMSKSSSRISAARRNAEALLGRAQTREANFKLDQEREREAMTLKIARLRELRLAKEAAADGAQQETALRAAPRPVKARRSKQT